MRCRLPGVNFCGVCRDFADFLVGVVDEAAVIPDIFFIGDLSKQRFLRAWCTAFLVGDLAVLCWFSDKFLRALSRFEAIAWRVFSLTPTFLVGTARLDFL